MFLRFTSTITRYSLCENFASRSFFLKKHAFLGAWLWAFTALFLSHQAYALPQTLPISGVLSDENGRGLNDTITLNLRIYNALSGGSALYEEVQNVVVENGYFAVYLGQQTPLDLEIFDADDLYLGLQVEDDDELAPRFPLGLVPFAARAAFADDAETLSGKTAADFAGVSHTHIAADLPADLADGDDDTTYTTTSPVVLNGTVIGLTDQCIPGQILKATQNSWACADDEGDTLTAVSPLVKNGASIALTACVAGQVLKSNGTGWSCAADEQGAGAGPTLIAGAGLLNNSNTWIVDQSVFQRRLSACGAGQAIRSSAEDGSVVCVDVGGNYSAGSGLSLSGSLFSVNTAQTQNRVDGTCASGFAMRGINQDGTVVCESIASTSISAGSGLSLSGSVMSADAAVMQNRVTGTCASGFAVSGINQDGSVVCRSLVPSSGGGYVVSTNLKPQLDNNAWTALSFLKKDGTTLSDDDGWAAITLPFAFSVFGTSSVNLVLSTNGLLYFDSLIADVPGTPTGSSYADWSNSILPSAKTQKPFLAAFWDDLKLVVARTRTLGAAPNRTFKIDVDAETFTCAASPCTFGYTITLHENGRIEVHYQDITADRPQGSSATFGLQGPGGSNAEAMLIGYNQRLLTLGSEVQFVAYERP